MLRGASRPAGDQPARREALRSAAWPSTTGTSIAARLPGHDQPLREGRMDNRSHARPRRSLIMIGYDELHCHRALKVGRTGCLIENRSIHVLGEVGTVKDQQEWTGSGSARCPRCGLTACLIGRFHTELPRGSRNRPRPVQERINPDGLRFDAYLRNAIVYREWLGDTRRRDD